MKTIATVNLTTNPIAKTDKKGFQYVSFGAAEDIKKRNADGSFEKTGVRYLNVTAYGKHAMELALELTKGDRVELSGEANLGVTAGGRTVNFFKMKDCKVIFKVKATAAAAKAA